MPTIDRAIGLLTCPVCDQPLARSERRLHCPNEHSFDLAKQGYVNLLNRAAPANADSAQMVDARDRFLGRGFYDPIRDAVVHACASRTADQARTAAEVGAGTGYYLEGVTADLNPEKYLGLDISAAAAKRAARSGLPFAVADTWQRLPLADESIDVLLCFFAPRNPNEFYRVLDRSGEVVVVTPLPGHLRELRERFGLLRVEDHKLFRLDQTFGAAELNLARREELRFSITMDPQAIANLIDMGPNAFHNHERTYLESVSVHVEVVVSVFNKILAPTSSLK